MQKMVSFVLAVLAIVMVTAPAQAGHIRIRVVPGCYNPYDRPHSTYDNRSNRYGRSYRGTDYGFYGGYSDLGIRMQLNSIMVDEMLAPLSRPWFEPSAQPAPVVIQAPVAPPPPPIIMAAPMVEPPAPVVSTAPALVGAMTKAVIVLNDTNECIKIRDAEDGLPPKEYKKGDGRQVSSFANVRITILATSCPTTYRWVDPVNNVVSVVCK